MCVKPISLSRDFIGITHALRDSMVAAPDLTSSITHTLRRTYGWLELGCAREALNELEDRMRAERFCPDGLEVLSEYRRRFPE